MPNQQQSEKDIVGYRVITVGEGNDTDLISIPIYSARKSAELLTNIGFTYTGINKGSLASELMANHGGSVDKNTWFAKMQARQAKYAESILKQQ